MEEKGSRSLLIGNCTPEKELKREESPEVLLRSGCRELNISIEKSSYALLFNYLEELKKWSKKINLVGKKQSTFQLVENHFLDSLMLLTHLDEESSLLDVGTGAGFPGLICKVGMPSIDLHLIEPRLKRISFLKHIIRNLKIEGVQVIDCRIEEYDTTGAFFSHITSRAVAEIGVFIEMLLPFLTYQHKIVLMKGPKWQDEIDKCSELFMRTGVELLSVQEFELPFSHAKRAILTLQRKR